MFRRVARFVVLMVLAAGAAAALLHRPKHDVRPAPGAVVVTYWEKWTGDEGAQMEQIVGEFNDTVGRHKGIFVQYLSVSNVNQKTLVATAAGVPPDVAGVWDGQIAQFAAMDALEPLDDLAAEHGITEALYKPVYWRACHYEGRLWGLISTPACVALHYNKRIFQECADALRAAGLDPDRPPRTLEELDRYAAVLDRKRPGTDRWDRYGYLPMEPGWFLVHTAYWFGGSIYDEAAGRFTLTDEPVVRAYEWIRSYSLKLGRGSMMEFVDSRGAYASPQNAFLVGTVAMQQQGPWMANTIESHRPAMNRWKFGAGLSRPEKLAEEVKLSSEERRANYEWGAAPFPSVGGEIVTYAGFDVLVIPRGARHKREAFEFIAYINRADVQEKLCSLHCKNTMLRSVSDEYIRNHPNPYIEVFETMASSPAARGIPPIPIWPEVDAEMAQVAQKVYLLTQEPRAALEEAQLRLQAKLDQFNRRQQQRRTREASR